MDLATILGEISTDMVILHLDNNQFTGTIPASVSNFTWLWEFYVGGNQLTGDITSIIDNMPTELHFLHLDNNQFTGTIPSTISNIVFLEELDVSNNSGMNGA